MRLTINGEEKDLPGITTLQSLVDHLELKADRLAVELNLDIVPRSNWATTNLKDNDKLEIVHFVGGGKR
ncbi:MAG TPA: sulfur carrier protein ThiS [Terriglobales bacterium]|nr:sulfur carrier protein ThiS [Terriglobales bacterium]